MKKLKSFITKIKSGMTLKTYQNPLVVTIVTLILINIVVLILCSFLGLAIDTEGVYFEGSFIEAFAQCILWMITPTSITKYSIETDIAIMILGVVVIAVGMILFSGAIIATLTTALRALVDSKSKAQGAIVVENHFVILNWNSKVPDMIYNLFVKGYKGNIIILSNKNKAYVEGEVSAVMASEKGKKKGKIKLIVKEGNPLLHNNLDDISIEKASNICIMAREDLSDNSDDNILNSDLLSLKVVLALGNFDINPECNIVVETDAEDICTQIKGLSKTIESLRNKSIIPVSFNKKIGQIIAQTLIDPMLADIYLDLFSYEGYEFYSYGYDGSVEDFLSERNNAIPVIKYDRIHVLAEDDSEIFKARDKKELFVRPMKITDRPASWDFTLFVIGENKKSEYIIENLRRQSEKEKALKVKTYEKNDTAALIRDLGETEGIKRVLILSDDKVSEDSYDANVFVSLIALSNAFPKRENMSFITELLDSRNLQSVRDFNIKNAIISNKMISLLLTNLALNRESLKFFENLITVDDEEGGECFDIQTKKASEILGDETLSFASRSEFVHSFYFALEKKRMLIGMVKESGEREYFASDQDATPVTVNPEDCLIYIAY